jgi:hypothetical protein
MSQTECPSCAWQVRGCRRLRRALQSGFIELDSFAYNYSLHAVYGYDCCTESCVDALHDELVADCYSYLRKYLEPVDFKPCPRVFLSGSPSEEEIHAKQHALRPKYLRLFELVRRRAAGGAGSTRGDVVFEQKDAKHTKD